jgi:hypothetical protein
MGHSLKEFLFEERKEDVVYVEKKAKNEINKVIAELKGHEASVMSLLARRFDRLNTAIKLMGKKRDDIKKDLKERVAELFNAEEEVLTRVVDTAAFTLTLNKVTKKAETKTVIDYESIAEKLCELIPDELQAKVDEIIAAYTKIDIMPIPEPGFKVTNKAAKEAADKVSVEEGFVDTLSKLCSRLYKSITSWSKKFDKKLKKLEAQLGREPLTEEPVVEGKLWKTGDPFVYQKSVSGDMIVKMGSKTVGKIKKVPETPDSDEGFQYCVKRSSTLKEICGEVFLTLRACQASIEGTD